MGSKRLRLNWTNQMEAKRALKCWEVDTCYCNNKMFIPISSTHPILKSHRTQMFFVDDMTLPVSLTTSKPFLWCRLHLLAECCAFGGDPPGIANRWTILCVIATWMERDPWQSGSTNPYHPLNLFGRSFITRLAGLSEKFTLGYLLQYPDEASAIYDNYLN